MPRNPGDATFSACAKSIIVGEHFVVHHAPAIAIPLPLRTTIRLRQCENPAVCLHFPGHPDFVERVDEDCAALTDFFALPNLSLGIDIDSEIPIGQGFGSSASYAVALGRAFCRFFEIDESNIAVAAALIEKRYHRNPSGIDHTTILEESPIFYRKNAYEKIKIKGSFHFIVASTGICSDTSEVVRRVSTFRAGNKKLFLKILNDAEALALSAKSALENGDWHTLAIAMNENQNLLRTIHVSCDESEALIERAISLGAVAAKISGAGAGGAVIALCDADNVDFILQNLRSRYFAVCCNPIIRSFRLPEQFPLLDCGSGCL